MTNTEFLLHKEVFMLELKNVYINLISDSRQIVENFSFALNRGDKAVIIGEEGNGKSTC